MTTQWAADKGESRPEGRWEAPRIAYAIAAAYAEAAASGGGGGPALPPGAAKIWDDLTAIERHDVADALRGQYRAALSTLTRQRLLLTDSIAAAAAGPVLCAHARMSAAAMLSPTSVPWRLPDCPDCEAACAAILCGAQVAALALTGFPLEQVAAELAQLADGAPASVMYVTGSRM